MYEVESITLGVVLLYGRVESICIITMTYIDFNQFVIKNKLEQICVPNPLLPVISLPQPWATLWARGIKRFHIADQFTDFRGLVMVHVNKEKINEKKWSKIIARCLSVDDSDTLAWRIGEVKRYGLYGGIVGVVNIDDCKMITSLSPNINPFTNAIEISEQSDLELLLGDWRSGKYAWSTDGGQYLPSVIKLETEIGFWFPSFEIQRRVRNNIIYQSLFDDEVEDQTKGSPITVDSDRMGFPVAIQCGGYSGNLARKRIRDYLQDSSRQDGLEWLMDVDRWIGENYPDD